MKVYTVLHMFRQVLFGAGNQDNHQNFEKSLLTNKLWYVFMGMKQKKIQNGRFFKIAIFQNRQISKLSWIGSWVSRIDWCKGHWCSSTYMVVRLSNVTAWKHKKMHFFYCFWFYDFRVPTVTTKAKVNLRVQLLWFSTKILRIKFQNLFANAITTWLGSKNRKCLCIYMYRRTRQSCLIRSDNYVFIIMALVTQPMMQRRPNQMVLRLMDSYI